MFTIYVGTFGHTPHVQEKSEVKNDGTGKEKYKLEIIHGAIEVNSEGFMVKVIHKSDFEYDGYIAQHTIQEKRGHCQMHYFPEDQFILPGLIDLHVHAPQYMQTGNYLDLPLQDWLLQHTLPSEACYSDVSFASTIYDRLVSNLLSQGTTCAVYFATIHCEATKVLVDLCLEKGQRGFIGKVCMDNPETCPEYYIQDVKDNIEGTVEVIEYIKGHKKNENGLIKPVVTPRFLPSCSDALLGELGKIAAKYDCHVQSHLSESDWVVSYGNERFKRSDTKVFNDFGLLTNKCIMAHSVFLDDDDLQLFSSTRAGIAHCPLSNFYFADALFPYRAVCDKGVRVGLGTDVGGGFSSSMFNSMRHAMTTSLVWRNGVDPHKKDRGTPNCKALNFIDVLYAATLGGAMALGAEDTLGTFEEGKSFDAIQLKMGYDVHVYSTQKHKRPLSSSSSIINKAKNNNNNRINSDYNDNTTNKNNNINFNFNNNKNKTTSSTSSSNNDCPNAHVNDQKNNENGDKDKDEDEDRDEDESLLWSKEEKIQNILIDDDVSICQKLIHGATGQNISKVFVQGKVVYCQGDVH